MTKYVYLNNIRKSTVRSGISTKVFNFIAEKALKNVNGIILDDDNNNVSIGLKNNVVVFRITTVIKKGLDKEAVKKEINEYITNTMNFICDSMPFEITIKLYEKKDKDDGKWNWNNQK